MTIEPAGPRRVPAGAMSGITGLRLHPPGAEGSLVNISPTGLLAESPAKLRVGSPVEVQIHGGFTPSSIAGHVVRCEVAIMQRNGVLRYHIAIEFDSLIPLADEQKPPAVAAQAPSMTVKNRW